MPKVLIPLADGFEEIEAITLIDILRRAKIEVVVAGLHQGTVTSARSVTVQPDTSIDEILCIDFDMIVLPGGQPGTDNLNADHRIHGILKEFDQNDKLIGAICAAPIVLAKAGLLSGKRATSYPDYRCRLSDVLYELQTVVSDQNIMTSRGAGTAIDFALAIVTRLVGSERSREIAQAILYTREQCPL